MDDFERLSRYDRRSAYCAASGAYGEAQDPVPSTAQKLPHALSAMLPFNAWRNAAITRLETRIEAYTQQLPVETPLRAPIAYALDGGKRFRALLAIACCEALGGAPADALDVALALEMVQAQSLILDDLPCMDDADNRRDRPAVHRRFGESMALLAAATLLSDAYATLCERADPGASQRVRILADACGSRGIAHGQAAELASTAHAIAAKTSPLIAASAHLGALCAPAPQPYQIEALTAFAQEIGVAYQLRDDALDGDTDRSDVLHAAQTALDRGLWRLARANLDTPTLRALARFAVIRPS
jgi:geranylgeranyl diphosphate synthase, type II